MTCGTFYRTNEHVGVLEWKAGVDNLTLGRVLWRSFFLQASWNYKGKQNIGAAAALTPALEKLYGRKAPALVKALERSLEPFNTQPYMAGPILGALIKSEELVIEGGFPMERLTRLKAALTTAFAAIGDALFWNAILPATAAIGLFWSARGRMDGVFLFLILYNLLPMSIRTLGFWRGYQEGLNVAMVIDRFFPATAGLAHKAFHGRDFGAFGRLVSGRRI